MEQLVARRAHNPEAVGSNPAPATKKTHSELNAPSFLISTHPGDCKDFGDLSHVHVSAVRCTQVSLKSVYVQLRLDIKINIWINEETRAYYENSGKLPRKPEAFTEILERLYMRIEC